MDLRKKTMRANKPKGLVCIYSVAPKGIIEYFFNEVSYRSMRALHIH